MGKVPSNISNALQNRSKEGLLRSLTNTHSGIDFISNDYLGFSKLGLVTKKANQLFPYELLVTGSGGSRLISGNTTFIDSTEKKIAAFHNADSALIFNSGYDANLGLLSSVPQKNDLVITDELIHASLIDGVRLSYAKHYKFKHNDVKHLEELLMRHANSFENVFVVVESVYSMDGDEAPLLDITELIGKVKNVFLIVDEAHAIGVFGKSGKGLCTELNIEKMCFARIYTYGKALGCHGAAIVGSEDLRSYLINFARSFIYTTALPSHSIANISAGYELLLENSQHDQLQNNIGYFVENVKHHFKFIKSRSAIQCLLLNDRKKADELERTLRVNNILCKAVKSPTVKEGSERIRFCLHAFNTKSEIDQLIEVLSKSK
ncbi:MAG: aminotransferase class I/II-fold pyridoxal phosphate-dependent enzyme [Sphingobacteriaceae bacterium]|jgi:8-amino-7-oxononanoate synthase